LGLDQPEPVRVPVKYLGHRLALAPEPVLFPDRLQEQAQDRLNRLPVPEPAQA
jgi:hypothetical protein